MDIQRFWLSTFKKNNKQLFIIKFDYRLIDKNIKYYLKSNID